MGEFKMKKIKIQTNFENNKLKVIIFDFIDIEIICDYVIVTNSYIDLVANIVNKNSYDLVKRIVGLCDIDIQVKPADQWKIEYKHGIKSWKN
jgi:hypothetical protein